jgi:murein DD-endopeptidase MepM/ murein hydrolase activator NlpD
MSTSVRSGLGRAVPIVPLLALLAAAPASGGNASLSGGAGYTEPAVKRLVCKKAARDGCPRGATLRVKGQGLAHTTEVVFRGGRGGADDRTAMPVRTNSGTVTVVVPAQAVSGPVRAVVGGTTAEGPRLKVSRTSVTPTAAAGSGIFPIRARHSYGDGIGAGRGHEGQDVFARCGARLVSALDGRVTHRTYHSRAGNYVVVKAADGTSQAYMHMAAPAEVQVGDRVTAGQRIGEVGDTGRVSGCHLHFELWSAPGYYEGGSPIDPLPTLKRWDRTS